MRRLWKIILFGFLIWLIPFVASVMIFPIHEAERPLFESLMAVIVTVCTVGFSILYLRSLVTGYAREGIVVGLSWLAISLLIDLPLFSAGPMAMPVADYIKDIGLTYLIIPAVAIGCGYLLEKKAG